MPAALPSASGGGAAAASTEASTSYQVLDSVHQLAALSKYRGAWGP